ncbi:MAG: hypothetical protein ACR2OZ_13050 [Verrucomicrobiales bacterium]
MDALILPLIGAEISAQLGINAAAIATSGFPRWSDLNDNLETPPTGVAANVLMATLQNNTGLAAGTVAVNYDLAVANTPAEDAIPGHRVYYSLTGAANDWVPVGNFGTAGPVNVLLPVGNWAAGSQMFVLWADDNSLTNPDGLYQIDNVIFNAVPIPEPSLGLLAVLGSAILGLRRRRL